MNSPNTLTILCVLNSLFCIVSVVKETGGATEGGDKLTEKLCMIYRAAGPHFIYLYCSIPQRMQILASHPVPN